MWRGLPHHIEDVDLMCVCIRVCIRSRVRACVRVCVRKCVGAGAGACMCMWKCLLTAQGFEECVCVFVCARVHVVCARVEGEGGP